MLLFLALLIVPLIEIALFIEVGGWIGLWPTIAVVILTAIAGTILLRAQGVATLRELQERLQRGEDPGTTLAHGALILVAGVVLLTPGFFTDAVGFALLIPPVRAFAITFLAKRIRVAGHVHMSGTGGGRGHGSASGTGSRGQTIDGEFETVEPGEGAQSDPRPDPRTAGRPSGWGNPPTS